MKQEISRIISSTCRVATAAFGEIHYAPPEWMHVALRHKVRCVLILASCGLSAWAGLRCLHYLKGRPAPALIAAKAEPIPVTQCDKQGKILPPPLVIRFSCTVAPLHAIGQPLHSGVRMEPAFEGRWSWVNDRNLQFFPNADWPADSPFAVSLDPAALAPGVLLESRRIEFRTPAFSGNVKDLILYQDPRDPAVKEVTATLEFTHPVSPEELRTQLQLAWVGAQTRQPFNVTCAPGNRLAYIRSGRLELPERPDFVKLTVPATLRTSLGGARLRQPLDAKVPIPDRFSFFRITGSEATIVRSSQGDPEQVLVIQGTAEARSEEVFKNAELWLLPPRPHPVDEAEEPGARRAWQSPAEITPEVLATAKRIPMTLVPSAREHSKTHAFKFRHDADGQLYFRIAKGTHGLGDFMLGSDYTQVMTVPIPPPEIEIQGSGGVLALHGERRISIMCRGVPALRIEVCRVLTDQINHLVSQTRGDFQNPRFLSFAFDEENVSRIAEEIQAVAADGRMEAVYSSFDLGPHLATPSDGGSERGLFFIRVQGWDPGAEEVIRGTTDRRFLLVTDIGLIVKAWAEGSRDVFAQSIASGQPLAGVTIEILGKNGIPLASGVSDAEGRVTLPSQAGQARERDPVALVASLGADTSFLPFDREDRTLSFSRFDTGGDTYADGGELEAFVFTERGIYRPGDTIHAGIMLKRRDWRPGIEGIPIEVEFIDAAGQSALCRKLAVPASGFTEIAFPTRYDSPSGPYAIRVHLTRDGRRSRIIGTTSAMVKEFLPDRMKIASSLNRGGTGWSSPDGIVASIELLNFYGTPAGGRTIRARLELTPAVFEFPDFPGYHFHDRLLDETKGPHGQSIEIGDQQTDITGMAEFVLDLAPFAKATYALTFFAEGFEADSGRSVVARNRLLVSPLPHLVGHKSGANLAWLPAGQPQEIELVAIDPRLNRISLDGLRLRVTEVRHVSVLTRQENGNYAYESVRKEQDVCQKPFAIPADGAKFELPTADPGDFFVEIRDAEGNCLSRFSFSVVGSGNAARPPARDAELRLKLARTDLMPGDEIEVAITAPYAGAGLITLERERVFAHRWFKSVSHSSTQRIRIPADFEGTGYVNVTFVRALDSREIFTSPLSYAAVPFTCNRGGRRLAIDLKIPDKARPGEPFRIRFSTDRPSRIALFAVDEGILQVTGFQTPDPLEHFFRKSALGVRTAQLADMLLPEFSLLRALSAPGGDEGAPGPKTLNPFRRTVGKPVVFWSGILEAGPEEREVAYEVPDYFNGTLAVMAVALSGDAAGHLRRDSLIRGPYAITPNLPVQVAPGDIFECSATLSAEKDGDVMLTAEPSEHLQIVSAPAGPISLQAGRDTNIEFRVRATDKLGDASLLFRAKGNGGESRIRWTLSVRPAVTFMTRITGGNFRRGSLNVPVNADLLPEYRTLETVISATPLGLAHGLRSYLLNYPHGCSEQITSAAFCRLLLADDADFGLDRKAAAEQIEATFQELRRRQNDQGAFGFWTPRDAGGIDFLSVYVTRFLADAKAAGFPPPEDLLRRALAHLNEIAASEPKNLDAARTIACAIYVLTSQGVVTTNPILNLRDSLAKITGWQNDLIAVYLAGALAQLQKTGEALDLIRGYKPGGSRARSGDFWQPLSSDADYVTILARHFPQMLRQMEPETLWAVFEPIGDGHFNTLSAAHAIMALKACAAQTSPTATTLGISEIARDRKASPLETTGTLVRRTAFSPEAASIRFTGTPGRLGAFYQIVTSGFDRAMPDKPERNGIEVWREIPAEVRLGEPVEVVLRVRNLTGRHLTNVAIIDLLPGGFEILPTSLQPGAGSAGCDFVEVREDRAVFFTHLDTGTREIRYRIKATSKGEFATPPAFAEAMYETEISGRGAAGRVKVVGPQ